MIEQKICAKKNIVEALNRYEKHSIAGRRKIKPFLLENGSEKKLEQSAESET